MRSMRLIAAIVLALTVGPVLGRGQTLATSTVTGTVMDPSGAVVPGAAVELLDPATGTATTALTNSAGLYKFVSVRPGKYKITVKAAGFRQAVVPEVTVEVGKSYVHDISLQVGAVQQVVEIQANAGAELQTLDATVGGTVGGDTLMLLPSPQRDITFLLLYQPTAAPGRNQDSTTGGQVAGARGDQNTFLLDGGDVTNDTDAIGGYAYGFSGIPKGAIPTPAESIEEFRVGTNNPSATFSRSSGAQVIMASKHGTNNFHGSVYEYYQGNALNPNTWGRNRLGRVNPRLVDNRFGGSVGGPILKNKTFFFFNYEGHRFNQAPSVEHLVPTPTLRQGILRFKDAAGNTVGYNLASSTLCGPTNSSPCDPRGRGISPVVSSVWNQFMPLPNDFSIGDGLNTAGFQSGVSLPVRDTYGRLRLDHNFSEKWRFMAQYIYYHHVAPTTNQVDFGGLLPGDTLGVPAAVSNRPSAPRYLLAGVTMQLKPTLTNDFRFNYTRNFWQWATVKPFPQVSGTSAPVQILGETQLNNLIPMNIDTQQARGRIWNGHDWVFNDNATWIKGNHSFQFGGSAYHQWFFHQRDDKVVGGLTSLIYQVFKGSGTVIPAANRPPNCGGGITTNCLLGGKSGGRDGWDNLYTSTLGMVDNATILTTRDGSLNPNPLGTPIRERVRVNSYNLFVNDTWRLKRSLTLSYGLNWGVQLPPVEEEGKQTLMIDTTTNKILDTQSYLSARQAAALAGNVFNPTVGFLPVGKTGRKYPYDPDWHNFGPRIAAAWSPSFGEGFLGKIFGGASKSVIRGGYSLTYDRFNGVGLVMLPILGVGYGQAVSCRGPNFLDGACHGSGGSTPATGFRIGVDGSTVPLPSVTAPTLPIIPGVNQPFERLSFQIDPTRRVGPSHEWDFSLQRELPGNTVLEVGYIGRHSSHLYQGVDLNQVPFFMKRAGQSFAQAFDAVATALRANQTPAAQPFFENALKPAYCAGNPSCTAAVANNVGSDITNGDMSSVWGALDPNFVFGPTFATTNQVGMLYMISDFGRTNYNAGFIQARKRTSHGLTLDVNFTYSRTLDNIGLSQEELNSASNAYDLNYDYGPSLWDRKFVFNAFGSYELPFGRGKRFSISNRVLDKVISGWTVAPVYNQYSGLPLCALEGGNDPWGGGLFGNSVCTIPLQSSYSNTIQRAFGPVGGTAGNGNPAKNGPGLNLFADPVAAYNSFRPVLASLDQRSGGAGQLRGQPRWNLDMTIAKATRVTERVNVQFVAQFLNILNHVMLKDPTDALDLQDPENFGVIGRGVNAQYNEPRSIVLGLRIQF